MVTKGRAMLAGICSAAVALGVAELIAIWTGARTSPLVAVGGAVIDLAPPWGKELAVELFGTNDKLALLIGTGILLAGFAALIGLAARRNFWLGVAGIGLFAAIGIASALTRADAGAGAVLPTLIGCAAAAGVLYWLMQPQVAGAERRRFLQVTLGVLGGAVVAGLVGRYFAQREGVQQARGEVKTKLPEPVSPAPALPANVDPKVEGLSRYVTSNEDFYRIDTAIIPPQVDPSTWKLRIHGRVDRPVELTFEQLLARPMVERYVTLACVSNEVGGDLISNARFLGVLVKDLLNEAGPQPGADQVVSRSADGWTCGTPTAALLDGRDAMLAVAMNGEPLPIEHGFPVRMVVPGLYGYVSACKWIVEMELSTFADFDAYWIKRGWAAQGPIKTESRIDTPRDGATVSGGQRTIAGVAWAQHRGISNVEVRVDDGPWQLADLAGTVGPDTWRQWSVPWQASAGRHRIQVRAADVTGEVQTAQETPVAPDGATGWHTISVTVS